MASKEDVESGLQDEEGEGNAKKSLKDEGVGKVKRNTAKNAKDGAEPTEPTTKASSVVYENETSQSSAGKTKQKEHNPKTKINSGVSKAAATKGIRTKEGSGTGGPQATGAQSKTPGVTTNVNEPSSTAGQSPTYAGQEAGTVNGKGAALKDAKTDPKNTSKSNNKEGIKKVGTPSQVKTTKNPVRDGDSKTTTDDKLKTETKKPSGSKDTPVSNTDVRKDETKKTDLNKSKHVAKKTDEDKDKPISKKAGNSKTKPATNGSTSGIDRPTKNKTAIGVKKELASNASNPGSDSRGNDMANGDKVKSHNKTDNGKNNKGNADNENKGKSSDKSAVNKRERIKDGSGNKTVDEVNVKRVIKKKDMNSVVATGTDETKDKQINPLTDTNKNETSDEKNNGKSKGKTKKTDGIKDEPTEKKTEESVDKIENKKVESKDNPAANDDTKTGPGINKEDPSVSKSAKVSKGTNKAKLDGKRVNVKDGSDSKSAGNESVSTNKGGSPAKPEVDMDNEEISKTKRDESHTKTEINRDTENSKSKATGNVGNEAKKKGKSVSPKKEHQHENQKNDGQEKRKTIATGDNVSKKKNGKKETVQITESASGNTTAKDGTLTQEGRDKDDSGVGGKENSDDKSRDKKKIEGGDTKTKQNPAAINEHKEESKTPDISEIQRRKSVLDRTKVSHDTDSDIKSDTTEVSCVSSPDEKHVSSTKDEKEKDKPKASRDEDENEHNSKEKLKMRSRTSSESPTRSAPTSPKKTKSKKKKKKSRSKSEPSSPSKSKVSKDRKSSQSKAVETLQKRARSENDIDTEDGDSDNQHNAKRKPSALDLTSNDTTHHDGKKSDDDTEHLVKENQMDPKMRKKELKLEKKAKKAEEQAAKKAKKNSKKKKKKRTKSGDGEDNLGLEDDGGTPAIIVDAAEPGQDAEEAPPGTPKSKDSGSPTRRRSSIFSFGSRRSSTFLSPDEEDRRPSLLDEMLATDPEFSRYMKDLIKERRASHRSGKKSKGRKSVALSEEGRSLLSQDDSDDDLINIYGGVETSEARLRENIQLQKDIISRMRLQPWPMKRKLKALALANAYVERYEGRLSKGRGSLETGAKVLRRLKREVDNLIAFLIPWEMRIKRIESHFGSVVASYFTFLRWAIWVNIVVAAICCFMIAVPEFLSGNPYGSTPSKTIPPEEQADALNLNTFMDFEGYIKYSIMFYGYYGNEESFSNGYRLPLAYFIGGILAFVINFVFILRRMAANARAGSLAEDDDQYQFSWRLFQTWDYMIGNAETAKNKVAEIVTNFKELIVEEEEKTSVENPRLLKFLRVFANFLCMIVLAASTYAIVLVVNRSQEFEVIVENGGELSWWEANEVSMVTSLITALFPNIFDLIGMMEKYHPRVNLQWQLARILVLYLLNMYTLMIALYWKITDSIDGVQAASNSTSCVEKPILASDFNATEIMTTVVYENCTTVYLEDTRHTVCWETDLGQELAKLTLFDLYVTAGFIIAIDFIRGLVVRYCGACFPWDLETTFPEYGEFKLAENLLHLINNQAVMWLGMFFSPLLPAFNLIKLVIMQYLRSWAVIVCNIPPERIFKASRSNNFYYGITLLMLFLSAAAILFLLVSLPPSYACGPFRDYDLIYHVLTETMYSELPSFMLTVLDYATSATVILPVLLILCMAVYYLRSSSKSLAEANKSLTAQLQFERTEEKRKVYQMADAKKKEEEKRLRVPKADTKKESAAKKNAEPETGATSDQQKDHNKPDSPNQQTVAPVHGILKQTHGAQAQRRDSHVPTNAALKVDGQASNSLVRRDSLSPGSHTFTNRRDSQALGSHGLPTGSHGHGVRRDSHTTASHAKNQADIHRHRRGSRTQGQSGNALDYRESQTLGSHGQRTAENPGGSSASNYSQTLGGHRYRRNSPTYGGTLDSPSGERPYQGKWEPQVMRVPGMSWEQAVDLQINNPNVRIMTGKEAREHNLRHNVHISDNQPAATGYTGPGQDDPEIFHV